MWCVSDLKVGGREKGRVGHGINLNVGSATGKSG